jgi:hypothetical protein
MYLIHRLMEVTTEAFGAMGAKAFILKGATTTTYGMMELETDFGGGTISTSLTKRSCWIW